MKEITTCEVINKSDKKKMTVITEWMEDEVRIILLRSGLVPLIGETTVTKLMETARSEKTREEFFQDIRNELSGKDKDVQFSWMEPRFSWTKKVWRKGTVEMRPIEDTTTLATMNIEWLSDYSSSQETMFELRKENEILREKSDELTSKIKEIETMKKSMEETLYKQFLLLLNTKKRRIRELEEKLSSSPKIAEKPTIFEENTDNSDVDEEKVVSRKRPNPEETTNPKASTSKKALREPLNFTPDSDDEIVLRYDESQVPNTRLNTEEEPEDDLFSQ